MLFKLWKKKETLRYVLLFSYLILLCFYTLTPTFCINYNVYGTISTHNQYVWFSSICILVFSIIISLFKNIKTTTIVYIGSICLFSLILVGSTDMLTLYISFEALSFLTYGVIVVNKTVGSTESSLKYFIYGSISSIFLIFGISLYFITFKSLDIYEMAIYKEGLEEITNIVSILIILAFGYKLSLFPLQFVLPDLYEGSNWEAIAVINILIKVALFLLLFKLWSIFTLNEYIQLYITKVIIILSLLSLIIGCFGALLQISIKRFLAYTSINQTGFILLGLITNNEIGLQASIVYLITYILTLVIFFSCLINETKIISINDLKKLSSFKKYIIASSLFSMAGIPPFFGFISKYLIWVSIITRVNESDASGLNTILAVVTIISIIVSFISAYYYLRIIKVYMFDNSLSSLMLYNKNKEIIISLCILFMLVLGWFILLEDILNISWLWARDSYGSWGEYIYTGRYDEWLRSL